MTRMSGFISVLLLLFSFQASARLVTEECKIPAGVYKSTNTLAGHEIELITDGHHGVFQLQHSGTEKTVFFVMSRPKPPPQTEAQAASQVTDASSGDIQAQRRGRGKHGHHRPGHRPPHHPPGPPPHHMPHPPGPPPHHMPHPPGGPGHHMPPPPPIACKETHLNVKWNANQSIPAGISGGFAGIYDPADKTIQGVGELKIEGASGKGPTVLAPAQ